MPTYAVKIGEVFLQSDKPITEEERKQAITEFKRTLRGAMMTTRAGICIRVRSD